MGYSSSNKTLSLDWNITLPNPTFPQTENGLQVFRNRKTKTLTWQRWICSAPSPEHPLCETDAAVLTAARTALRSACPCRETVPMTVPPRVDARFLDSFWDRPQWLSPAEACTPILVLEHTNVHVLSSYTGLQQHRVKHWLCFHTETAPVCHLSKCDAHIATSWGYNKM